MSLLLILYLISKSEVSYHFLVTAYQLGTMLVLLKAIGNE